MQMLFQVNNVFKKWQNKILVLFECNQRNAGMPFWHYITFYFEILQEKK